MILCCTCVGRAKGVIKVTYVLDCHVGGRIRTKSNLVSLEVLPVCTYTLPLAVLSLLEAQLEAVFYLWLCDLQLQSLEILLWKQNSEL